MKTYALTEVNDRLEQWASRHPLTMFPEDQALLEEFNRRFPLETLTELPLERYAMGRGDKENYCYWLEHKTKGLGSIKGGTAQKFGVYWSAKEQRYLTNSMFSNEEDARQRILGAIREAADHLKAGEITEADKAAAKMGEDRYSLRLKPLYLYEPKLLLPITSPTHLQYFLRLFGQEPRGDQIAMNRQLLAVLRQLPKAKEADSLSLMRFLYDEFPPEAESTRKVWKVALGEQSQYLSDGLEHKVIFIGSHLLDLAERPSGELAAQMKAAGDEEGFALSAIAFTHKMQEGDVVIANQGMSRVMAVGLVEGPYLKPGVEGNPLTSAVLGERFPVWAHARQVDWLLTTPVDLPTGLTKLAMKTVSSVPEATLQAILDAYAKLDSRPEQIEQLRQLGWKGTVKDQPSRSEQVEYLIQVAQHTKNIILYGPPGTGKTYVARKLADALTQDSPALTEPASSSFQPRRWWQAVALALAEEGTATVPQLQQHPVIQRFLSDRVNNHLSQTLWQQLLAHTDPHDPSSNVERRTAPYLFTRSPEDNDRWQLNEEGEVLVKEWLTPVSTQAAPDPQRSLLEHVTFHPAFTYEEFVEGLRPNRDGGFEVRDGVFKRLCQKAHANPEQQFVLLIDEINRADTAKTFGELITLIEDDKRVQAGTVAEHPVTLPYSDSPDNQLSVPDNLYIIGTMNTADRSITLMDIALRRRFTFIEVPPQPELLSGQIEDTTLSPEQLLRHLNEQITTLLDKDHQIGHAYLMGKTLSKASLRFRWQHQIVPLLQEYFYAREDELRSLLGPALYEDAMGLRRLTNEDDLIAALAQLVAPKSASPS